MSSSKIMANSLDDSVFESVAKEETSQEILDAVNGMQTTLSGTLTANVVKKIQRGTFESGPDNDSYEVTITIQPINPEKSFVVLRGTYNYANATEPILKSLSSDKLVVFTDCPYSLQCSYEIVEYY